MIVKVAGLIMCETVLYIFLKKRDPEYAFLAEIAAVVLLFFIVSEELRKAVSGFENMFSSAGFAGENIKILFRVAGIASVSALTAEFCRDAGENALALNAEFAGKIMIVALAFPMLEKLIELIAEMVEKV